MNRKFENVSNQVSVETCIAYYALGFDCIWNDGKDLTLAAQKNEPSDGHLKSSQNKNLSNKSISKNSSANKTNYSTVCLRCGRKLRSEESRNRGYGSYCYKKIGEDAKKTEVEEVEQTFIDELRGMN